LRKIEDSYLLNYRYTISVLSIVPPEVDKKG